MTGQSPGKLWMYFLEAILVTIPASLVLLAGYRRAVNRSMRQLGDATTVPIPGTKAEPLDGAQAFVKSWKELLERIADKRAALAAAKDSV